MGRRYQPSRGAGLGQEQPRSFGRAVSPQGPLPSRLVAQPTNTGGGTGARCVAVQQVGSDPRRELRGCWSPEHVPHSCGLHGQGRSLIRSYSKIPGDVWPVFKRFKAKRASAGEVSPAKPEGGSSQRGRAGWALHPPLPARAASAGRGEAWLEEAAVFMQEPEKLFCKKLKMAWPELTRRKVHMCPQDPAPQLRGLSVPRLPRVTPGTGCLARGNLPFAGARGDRFSPSIPGPPPLFLNWRPAEPSRLCSSLL